VTDVEALVASVRSDPGRRDELLPLLHEAHPVYDGLGEAAALRTRGWVMAAFGSVGLPAEAVPAVLETLRFSLDPFSVAAAARAARGAVAPGPALPAALAEALVRLRGRDDTVSFAALRPAWPDPRSTTALTEVLRTVAALGPAGHAAHGLLYEARTMHARTWPVGVREALDDAISATSRAPLPLVAAPAPSPYVSSVPPGVDSVGSVGLEDQAGVRTTFDEHFRGRRHVVAFFYTRCGNPQKCSATVSRLAELARRLPEESLAESVGVAGISYDPGFDTPERLRAFGAERGMPFSATVRLFRAPAAHSVLREHFDLRVGYAGSVVNQHGVELYVVGADTRTEQGWTRVSWTVDEVLKVLRSRRTFSTSWAASGLR
jgi:cytochrome oxidase Cu insertion factor (SCO1/SenC/PrrC family)